LSLPEQEQRPDELRLFVAVEIPSDVILHAAEIMRKLQKGASFTGAVPSWVRAEGIHQTLVFLGSQPASRIENVRDAMRRATEGIQPFRLSLSGVRLFPNERSPRVICMDLHGDLGALEVVQSRLSDFCRSAGFDVESRPFKPHITLARIKSMRGVAGLANVVRSHKNEKAGRFDVNSIVLFRSILKREGAQYEVVHEQALTAKPPNQNQERQPDC
jgi:RNA 2',3'-cyclic 3'-phosphodiesterase